MTLPTYSTGTASVAVNGTVVTGVGGLWSGSNVKQGDFISIGTDAVLITGVTDATHLAISPWPYAAKTTQPYVIYQNYVGRVVGVAAAEDVGVMLEKLHTDGLPFIVDPGLTVPDPSYGDDGQFAFQPSTGLWWTKTGGVWVASPGLSSDASKVLKAGDTMTGALILNANPSAALGAAPKQYVDTRVLKVGDTMTGTLVLSGNPTAALDAAPKQYVDTRLRFDAAQTLSTAEKAQAATNLFKGPTTQVFTSGSGTYTRPANVLWIEIEAIGGGGGGAGSGTTPGTGGAGTATTWGTGPILSAQPGQGASAATGGAGGTPSGGFVNKVGAVGGNGSGLNTSIGGGGANSPYGGAGGGGAAGAGAGIAAAVNTGSGGGGGGVNTTINGGGGGGAAGFIRAIINSPLATYSYTVGAGGTAGTTGTGGAAGGAGGSGFIQVTEHYL